MDAVTVPTTPGIPTLFGRALVLHCPVCGQNKLFRHWTKMVERCPRCDYPFERVEGQFIGAVGMNTIITFGVLLITLVVGFVLTAPDIAVGTLVVIGLAEAILLPIFLYPFSKTVWTAIDLAMRPLEAGEVRGLDGSR